MIELLIEADRLLTNGMVDNAERLYRQVVVSDSKNAIALVGLARVALERGDDLGAYLYGRRALAIDPDNPAAQRLVMRMAELMAGRGATMPDSAPKPAVPTAVPPAERPETDDTPPAPEDAGDSRPLAQPGIIDRLLGRKRR